MKNSAFSSLFHKIVMFLFSFLFTASADHTHEDFLQLLVSSISNSTSTTEPIIYTPNDPSYYIVLNSSIRNGRFSLPSTPRPSVIVTPLHVSHAQATVCCSKKHKMQIRTRSGGHDNEGLSYVSKFPFVVVDLRNLTFISVDVESETAWVQAGANLGELYYRIAERSENLGFPAGDCYTAGVGGQFTGGGYGYLTRKYGLSADNVLDAELIDAEGRILDRKSMGEDLFWAIRGGGAESFGIVISWKLRLVHVPSLVTVFDVKRNMEDDTTKKLIHRWQRHADKVDEDLTIYAKFQTATSIDKDGNEKIFLEASFQATFHGSIDRLLQLMQREFSELDLLRQECTEMRWVESFLYFNGFRNGESLDVLLDRTPDSKLMSAKLKSDYVKEPISDAVFERMLGMLYKEEVGRALIKLFPCGGKMNEISESSIPYPHRVQNLYNIIYVVEWEENGNITTSSKHLSWVRRLYNYMTRYVSKNLRATYLNFRDLDIGKIDNENHTTSVCDNIARAKIWGPKYFKNNFNRLVHIKSIVDPTNFFTNEQSIPPFLDQGDRRCLLG